MEVDYRVPFTFDCIALMDVVMGNPLQQQRIEIVCKTSLPWSHIFAIEEWNNPTNPLPNHPEPKCKILYNNMNSCYVLLGMDFEDMNELFKGYHIWKSSQGTLFKKN